VTSGDIWAGLGRILKVLHIITGLEAGGAETMLLKLLTDFQKSGSDDISSEVVSLSHSGPLEAPMAALGIKVTSLGMSSGPGAFLKLARLKKHIRAARPDIVQTWMYHANLMGGLGARGIDNCPVIWGLRQSNLDPRRSKTSTRFIAKLCAWLSGFLPNRIVCVSESARQVHEAMGYDPDKMLVIPNGFDLDAFSPNADARTSVRDELGLSEGTPLVGLFARFDPQKDHSTFLRAAAKLHETNQNARYVLCGHGVDGDNPALVQRIDQAGLSECVHLLGPRNDMARLTGALDIAVSSSAFGEGFSNTIGEALSAGVPVVATDVGDARVMIGDNGDGFGRVVAPEDHVALARAMGEILALPEHERLNIGTNARKQMMRLYSIAAIAGRFRALYDDILGIFDSQRGV
jgi:glycosyltransferase involved in cell wall biosynthesis